MKAPIRLFPVLVLIAACGTDRPKLPAAAAPPFVERHAPTVPRPRSGACDRTAEVKRAIESALSKECRQLKNEDLRAVKKLELRGLHLTALSPGDFDFLSGLTELDLSSNQLASLPDGVFGDLGALESLNLSSNRLERLHTRGFAGLKKLRRLLLTANRIRTIETDAFADLSIPALQPTYGATESGIDLEGNRIASVQTGAFRGLPLQTLRLCAGDSLTKIDASAFAGLTARPKQVFLCADLRPGTVDASAFAPFADATTLGLGLWGNAKLPETFFRGFPSAKTLDLTLEEAPTVEQLAYLNELPALENLDIDFFHAPEYTGLRKYMLELTEYSLRRFRCSADLSGHIACKKR